jgi:malate dehydrogenase
MTKRLIRVAVTGGAGNIAYQLLFRLAGGDLFGNEQQIALHILDLPEMEKRLEGVCMELQDGAFPLLKEIVAGSDPKKVFKDIDYALLVGAKPRGPGMERGDLLKDNGKIFIEQGEALNTVASKDVKVLVVGNPCNTNCLIAMSRAPSIPRKNFMALTRLDENRAKSQLALRAGVDVKEVKNAIIWGNHSSTQVPDFTHATIGGKKAEEVIGDRKWLEKEFMSLVQKRGAAIIAARGASSAASAAHAVIDAVRFLVEPTPKGEWHSMAVCSDDNTYGIQENMIYSFPVRSKGDGSYEIVTGLTLDPMIREKIKLSEQELLEEKEAVEHLLGVGV